ncbi:hypothetical protein SBBP2_490002 [Burkholderiales bacterium]|nr:hypothetical protein SBBP2_490002 [Burkholderiales bacterium]
MYDPAVELPSPPFCKVIACFESYP